MRRMFLKNLPIVLFCFFVNYFVIHPTEDTYQIDNQKPSLLNNISISDHVVVRVWKPTIGKLTPIDTSYVKTSYLGSVVAPITGGHVGHVSLEIIENYISRKYMSFWPLGGLHKIEGSEKYFNKNFDDDCAGEGDRQQGKKRLPEFTKKLYSLNREAILKDFSEFEIDPMKRFYLWQPSENFDLFHCSSLSLRLLKKGCVADLFPDRPWYWGSLVRNSISVVRGTSYTVGGAIFGTAISGNPGGLYLGGAGGFGIAYKDYQDTSMISQEKDDDLAEYLVNPVQIANLTEKASKLEMERFGQQIPSQ